MMGVQGGVALGWVFAVGGGIRVHVQWDSWGGMWGGRNELGWVRIGESLTHWWTKQWFHAVMGESGGT